MLLLQFQQPVLMLHHLHSVPGSAEELFWCNNFSIQTSFPSSSISRHHCPHFVPRAEAKLEWWIAIQVCFPAILTEYSLGCLHLLNSRSVSLIKAHCCCSNFAAGHLLILADMWSAPNVTSLSSTVTKISHKKNEKQKCFELERQSLTQR